MKRRPDELARPDGFDLVVIGDGVHAGWIALDAARRGLSVAIVAGGDWGVDGPSPTAGLIHDGSASARRPAGGTRRRAAERRRLWKLGPHRVLPLRMLHPLYGASAGARLARRSARWLADHATAGRRPGGRTEWLDARDCRRRYRFLERTGLSGGLVVGECVCDDERLALELVAGAAGLGAVAVNHAPARRLLRDDGTATGVEVVDEESGQAIEVVGRSVAVCTPAGSAPELDGLDPPGALAERLVVTAVLPALPVTHGLVVRDGDGGQPLIVTPWSGRTLAVAVAGDEAPRDALGRLFERTNGVLGRTRWTESDALWTTAVAHAAPGGDPDAPATVDADGNGVWLVRGGGLTLARLDAARVVDGVSRHVGRASPCRTADAPLPWHPALAYRDWRRRILVRALELGLDEATADACRHRYGASISRLLELVERLPKLARRFLPDHPFCYGELVLAATDEMARGLDDALLRRVPLRRVEHLRPDVLRHAADIVGTALGWDDDRRSWEVARLVAGDRTTDPDSA